jgi:hypothetical protein
MNKLLNLFVFFGYLAIPSLAFAQATQVWWQVLLSHVLEMAVVVITPSLIILSRAFAQAMAKKNHIELAERQYALLDELVNKGVSFAHEQGRKALQEGKPLDSTDKKLAAVNFVNDGVNHLGLPGASKELLAQFIEARLNLRRDDPTKEGEIVKTNSGRVVPQ